MNKTIFQRTVLATIATLSSLFTVSAQTVESIPYRVILSTANEVPPVTTDASGGAFVFLHLVRDAQGEVISGSVDFQTAYKFASVQTITAMHIHDGAAGTNGPVVIDSGVSTLTDVTAGAIPTLQAQFDTDSVAALAAVKGILADPSRYYLNVHTMANPAGVFRGQLVRAQRAVRLAVLSSANENPPVTAHSASGRATVVIYRSVNANGETTSANVLFDVAYTGFPSGTTITAMHLHAGAAGTNGPVTVDSGLSTPITVADSGNGNLRFALEVDMARSGAVSTIENVFNNPSQVYLNIHTAANPAGAIRAQLLKTDMTTFPVVMSPAQEVPPVTLDVSAPARITVFTSRDNSGAITAGSILFDVNPRFANAPTTNFTAMHVHDGALGTNGPVTLDSRFNSVPVYFTAGVGNVYRLNSLAASAMASLNSLVTNPELHYANLHTSANPGGAVRAQMGTAIADKPYISEIIAGASDPMLTTLAPGGVAAIYGANFAKAGTNIDGITSDRVPTSFNGTSVTIGGIAAPIILLDKGQVNVQVPYETAVGEQAVVVTNVNGASEPKMATVAAAAPGILFDGTGGIAYRASTLGLIRPASPASANELLVFLVTGLGVTMPASETGVILPADAVIPTMAQPTVMIGGRPAAVTGAFAAPGFLGLYGVIAAVPSGLASGSQPVVMSAGGMTSNTVTIAVR